jgi:disulfide bond formation protein DsbB
MARQFDFVWHLGERWQSWAALLVLCFGLEAGALYYQHALMYYPCELCIYVRVWLAGIALVALAGLFLRKLLWPMRAMLMAGIALSIGLGQVVWKLLALDYGFAESGACSLYARFPQWAPLDQWFPTVFQVQATCGETPEVLFGLSMADGLAGVTVGLIVVLSLALIGSFRRG